MLSVTKITRLQVENANHKIILLKEWPETPQFKYYKQRYLCF